MAYDYRMDCRYYYGQMNVSEQRLYMFMVDLFLNYKYQFYFAYSKEMLPPDLEDLPIFIANYEEGYVDLEKVFDGIVWDWPELFYIARCYLECEFSKISIVHQVEYTIEEIQKIRAEMDRILHLFDHLDDDFEIELAVRDYIIDRFDYDDDCYDLTGDVEQEQFTVAVLLKRGKGVCAGYSLLAQYIFQRRGIFVANVIQKVAEDDEEEHSWLIVKIKGNYYHLDLTFDEAESKDPDKAQYMYFNLTTQEILVDHYFNQEDYPSLICNSTECGYYQYKGLYFTTLEQVEQKVTEFIEKNRESGKTKYLYFRMKDDSENKAVAKICAKHTNGIVDKKSIFTHNECGYYVIQMIFI